MEVYIPEKFIKKNYFNNVNNIIVARETLFSDIKKLFEITYEDEKNWSLEFQKITSFFNHYPKEFHGEIFFAICKNYLLSRPATTINEITYKSEVSFLNFIEQNLFSDYLPLLPQNVWTSNIITKMHRFFLTDNLILAKKYSDIFLSLEYKNIQKFSGILIPVLKENKKAALNFMIQNYSGWNDGALLEILFKQDFIYDDNFFDQLSQKIGKFDHKNISHLISYFNRIASTERINEIMDKYVEYDFFNSYIHSFYYSNIFSNKINLQNLIKQEHFFIKKLNNEQYLRDWITYDTINFLKAIPYLINNNLTDISVLDKIFPSAIPNEKLTIWEVISLIPVSAKYLNKSFNDEEMQKLLITIFSIYEPMGNYLLLLNLSNLNFEKPLTVNDKYKSLNDFLNINNNFLYQLYIFDKETNHEKKEQLFIKIEEQLNLVSTDKFDHMLSNFVSSNIFKNFYLYALKREKNINDFFNKWFIEKHVNEKMLNNTVRNKFFDFFIKEKNNISFTLYEDNPFFKFLKLRKDSFNNNTEQKLSHEDATFFVHMNNSFANKISHIETDNISLAAYCKKYNLLSNHHIDRITNESFLPKKKFGFNLFNKTKVLQISFGANGTTIITDPSQIIKKAENNVINTSSLEEGISLNNFDSLMKQAKNDAKNIHDILEKYSDKNLSIEVKIRSENLLLNNITFLESIKSGIDALNFEDTYFLKNNFGKYLAQCLDVYGKSITKYEVLLESNSLLSKTFSKSSEQNLESYKEKIDGEAIKQLCLLEKELELVKEHIINQFHSDLLSNMRVNTRILQNRIDNATSSVDTENYAQPDQKIIKIRK